MASDPFRATAPLDGEPRSAAGQKHNGSVGTLMRFNGAAGRWDTKFDDGAKKALKAENLFPISSAIPAPATNEELMKAALTLASSAPAENESVWRISAKF